MADIAEIGFVAKTDQLEKAKTSLNALSPAAANAEKAAKDLNQTLEKGRASTGAFSSVMDKAGGSIKNLFNPIAGLKSLLSGLTSQIAGLGAAFVGFFALTSAFNGARDLSKNIANLTTVLPDGTKNLDAFTAASAAMAKEFGTTAATQVDALYEAVSAGATSLQASTAIVDTANKLAIGGSSTLAQGIDVLTTATNAYAQSGLTAAQASDAIFVGVAAGKARVEEFARDLGDVVPIASSVGVKFDELTALISALTLSGIKVSAATTSVKQTLSAILSPTSQASKEAKTLGLAFDTTALKSKGLAGFLEDVMKKTHGDQTALAQLFGSVESLNGILSLTGAGGKNFNDILEQMKNKAGATDKAYQIMSENLDFRTQKLVAQLQNAAAIAGTSILQVIIPIGEAISAIIDGTSPLISTLQTVGTALLIAFSPLIVVGIFAITGAVASLAAFLTGYFIAAVYAAGAALIALALSNPFTAIALAITTLVALVWTFRDAINAAFGIDIANIAINSANLIIGAFVGGFNAIQIVWSAFPAVMTDVAIQAANGVVAAVQKMINKVIEQINTLLSAASAAANYMANSVGGKAAGFGGSKVDFTLPQADFGQMANPAAGAAAKAYTDAVKAIGDAQKNYIQQAPAVQAANNGVVQTLTKVAPAANAAAGGLHNAAGGGKKAAGGAGAAKDALEKLNDTFTKLGDTFTHAQTAFKTLGTLLGNGVITNQQYAASVNQIKAAFDAAGGSAQQWAQLSIVGMGEQFKALNEPFSQTQTAFNSLVELQKNGIITNDQYTASLQKLQDAFLASGGTSTQWGKVISKNTSDVGKQLEDLAKKSLTDLGDAFIELAMTGKANFKELASSIIKDLLRIMWQALIVKPLMASFGLGSGGVAGGSGGGSPTGGGFAKGAAFGPTRIQQFAGGGQFTNKLFNQPTMFRYAGGSKVGELGEKGPEAVMPLTRGSNGKLGVQAHGGSGGGKSTVLQMNIGGNTYNIEGAISQDQISGQIKQTSEQTLEVTRRSVAGWLQQLQRDGALV